MASLVQGGVPPRFLIIDDGWQCTDVDPPLRQPLSELPLPKNVKERVQETLTATKEEFVEAELEMLYMGSRNIPAGSSLGKSQSISSPP
jgi:raffinose synthase